MEPQDEFVFGLQAEIGRLMRELAAAKEEIERLKGEKEDMRQHCIHCIDDPEGALCRAVTMLDAAESSLTSERKETERLRGQSIIVSCGSCRRCKKTQMTDSVCKYRSGAFSAVWGNKPCAEWLPSKGDLKRVLQAALQSRHGEE